MPILNVITANIASYLPAIAEQQPETWAVIVQPKSRQAKVNYDQAFTYQQLNEESDRIANGLLANGIKKGTRIVLMVKPGLEFFSLVFAIFKIEAVLVAIDPGMGIKNLGKCLEEAEPEAFIGIPAAHIARVVLRWGKDTIKQNILVGENPMLSLFMPTLDQIKKHASDQNYHAHDTSPDDTAAILFTSGSTGIPKGVVYNHANFTAQVETLKSLYNIQSGEVDLATFPLFALFAPALGMTSVIPYMDFTRPGDVNPEKIIDAVIDYQCTNMFGSPALLNRVGAQYKNIDIKLSCLKRVLSAGAPVSANILKTYSKLVNDDVQIYTPYGATESLPVCSIGSHTIINETAILTTQGKGVCVGKPVSNIDLIVIRITDDEIVNYDEAELLEKGEIGELCVRGPQVTSSYFNRSEQTKLAKIYDGNDFYHRMGDLGYLDDQGRVWFCGRKNHRVETNDHVYYSDCVEGIFNTHPVVYRTALVGVIIQGYMTPVICVELEQNHQQDDFSEIQTALLSIAQRHDMTKAISLFLPHARFPVDIRHNAKINREQLAIWASRQLS